MDYQFWLECSLDYLGVQRVKLRVLSVLRKHSITESHPQPAWCVVFLSFFFKRFITYVCPHLFTCLCTPPATAGVGGSTQVPTEVRDQRALVLSLGTASCELSHMLAGTDLPFAVRATSTLDQRSLQPQLWSFVNFVALQRLQGQTPPTGKWKLSKLSLLDAYVSSFTMLCSAGCDGAARCSRLNDPFHSPYPPTPAQAILNASSPAG